MQFQGYKRGRYFFQFLICLVAVSFFGITGFLAWQTTYEQRHSAVVAQNRAFSFQMAEAMSLWLDDHVQIAKALALSPVIRNYCQNPRDMALHAQAADYLSSYHAQVPYFTLLNVMIFLQDEKGAIPVSVGGETRQVRNACSIVDSVGGRSIGVGGLDFSYIRAIYEGESAFISEGKVNAIPGLPPLFMVTVPIRGAEGHVVAALGFGVRLEYFSERFAGEFSSSGDETIEIVDSRGYYVGHKRPYDILKEHYRQELTAILPQLRSGAPTFFSADFAGEKWHFAASPISSRAVMATDWWAISRYPARQLDADIQLSLYSLAAACAVGTVMLLLLVFQTSHSFARELQHRAERDRMERKRVYVDSAPYGIILCDRQGRIVDVNPAVSKIFGRLPGELLALPLKEILPDQTVDANTGIHATQSCRTYDRHGRELVLQCDKVLLDGEQTLFFVWDESDLLRQYEAVRHLTRKLADSLGEAERASKVKSEFLA
ncbi:MAG: PAS domain-containing protein, partial [Desulfovibrionaceae bacterium]|nr:PAS domain-containing protein [Desulfovibrionaceae bacterium]